MAWFSNIVISGIMSRVVALVNAILDSIFAGIVDAIFGGAA